MRDDIRIGFWVRFTDDGIPAWFGPAWVEGAEFVEGVTAETLITHRRVDGAWQLRPPPPEPTPEDIARYEAERAAAEAETVAAASADLAAETARRIDEEVARRAAPDTLLRAMGKITIAELTARVAAIRATVEAETA